MAFRESGIVAGSYVPFTFGASSERTDALARGTRPAEESNVLVEEIRLFSNCAVRRPVDIDSRPPSGLVPVEQ